MAQLAEAVMYLHSEGIAHRDLKLENILIAVKNGIYMVKIIDFGLCCNVYRYWDSPCPNKVMGTARYFAPEIIKKQVVDARTPDIFALACVFYYILTKDDLFTGDDLQTVLANIRKNKHNNLTIIDENIANLVRMMILPVEERISIRKVVEKLWNIEDSLQINTKVKTL